MASREEKVKALMVIRDLSAKSDFNAAKHEDIVSALKKTYGGTSILLYRLRKDGLIFSPIRGCNRLTDEGRRFLNDILTSTQPMIDTIPAACSTYTA